MPITATVCPEDICVLHVKKIKEKRRHVYLQVKGMFNSKKIVWYEKHTPRVSTPIKMNNGITELA